MGEGYGKRESKKIGGMTENAMNRNTCPQLSDGAFPASSAGAPTTSQEEVEYLHHRNLYGASTTVAESPALNALKIRELEHEIDKLSDALKGAYFLALEQEWKQKTNYVRSSNFMLMFLRAEYFVAPAAALRLVLFFQAKLESFGVEKLPCPIVDEDLNEEDQKVLHSQYCQPSCGRDSGGRKVMFVTRSALKRDGLLQKKYEKNILRVTIYLTLHALEADENRQKEGVVIVVWNLGASLSFSEFQTMFGGFLKIFSTAIPVKFIAFHPCYDSPVENVIQSMITAAVVKSKPCKFITHYFDPKECLSELQTFGISRNILPLTQNGEVIKRPLFHPLFRPQGREPSHQTTIGMSTEKQINRADTVHEERELGESYQNESRKVHDHDVMMAPISHTPRGVGTAVAQVQDTATATITNATSCITEENEKGKQKLPWKLRNILQRNADPNAIQWVLDGTAFVINKKRFSLSQVLRSEFNGILFNSFQRRLRRWGFTRVYDHNINFTNAPNPGTTNKTTVKIITDNFIVYRHALFQKSSAHLLTQFELFVDKSPSKKETLPTKLMNILNSRTCIDSIWWALDGKAFAINTQKFSHEVLERDFDGMKLNSFYRTLRKWGFQRVYTQNHQENTKGMSSPEALSVFNNNDSGNDRAVATILDRYSSSLTNKDYKNADTSNSNDIAIFQHSLFQKNSPLFKANNTDNGNNSGVNRLWSWNYLTKISASGNNNNNNINNNKFPFKLYKILQKEERLYRNSIWWVNNGNSFAIKFETLYSTVLIQQFNGIKLRSFLRSLQRWGFEKIREEITPSRIAIYQHSSFKKNAPHLLENWTSRRNGNDDDDNHADNNSINSHNNMKQELKKTKITNYNKANNHASSSNNSIKFVGNLVELSSSPPINKNENKMIHFDQSNNNIMMDINDAFSPRPLLPMQQEQEVNCIHTTTNTTAAATVILPPSSTGRSIAGQHDTSVMMMHQYQNPNYFASYSNNTIGNSSETPSSTFQQQPQIHFNNNIGVPMYNNSTTSSNNSGYHHVSSHNRNQKYTNYEASILPCQVSIPDTNYASSIDQHQLFTPPASFANNSVQQEQTLPSCIHNNGNDTNQNFAQGSYQQLATTTNNMYQQQQLQEQQQHYLKERQQQMQQQQHYLKQQLQQLEQNQHDLEQLL